MQPAAGGSAAAEPWWCARIRSQIERYDTLRNHLRPRPGDLRGDLTPRVLRAHRADKRDEMCHLFQASYSAIRGFEATGSAEATFALFESVVLGLLGRWAALHRAAHRAALVRAALAVQQRGAGCLAHTGAVRFLGARDAQVAMSVCRACHGEARAAARRCPHLRYSGWRFWNSVDSASRPFMFRNDRWWCLVPRPFPLARPAAAVHRLLRALPPVRGCDAVRLAAARPLRASDPGCDEAAVWDPEAHLRPHKRRRRALAGGARSWEALVSLAQRQRRSWQPRRPGDDTA